MLTFVECLRSSKKGLKSYKQGRHIVSPRGKGKIRNHKCSHRVKKIVKRVFKMIKCMERSHERNVRQFYEEYIILYLTQVKFFGINQRFEGGEQIRCPPCCYSHAYKYI